MMKLFQRKHQLQLVAPVGGMYVDIRKVPVDNVTVGFALEPMVGEIQAPIAGEITQLTPQSVTIMAAHQCDVTVQLGQSTTGASATAFNWQVAVGDQVTPDTLLANMDLNALHEANQSALVICMVTNQRPNDFEIEKTGLVSQGDLLENFRVKA
ncbi:PTS glucose transporter subunit IIA [Lactiplantibacillus daowaiensis]|uniref:PTS glucose transporter subunit IIA n=1 Tax=Lactiplantibacillus daowaiensis TaxID=2559918 RepID=A0ABW1S1F9_9LACO|nr:PTS glucose transporter subunit IIA [Lactiplantibacillus daowaiensis]